MKLLLKTINKILFFGIFVLFTSTVFSAELADETEEEQEEYVEYETLSEEEAKALPDYWLRLINIMQKGLEVCNLEGNDFKVFGEDINLVTQSPFRERAPLEKIRFNQVLKSAKQHKAFMNIASQQIKINKIQELVKRQISLNDYMEATLFLLENFNDINDKRNKEILSYFSYMVSYDPLSDDEKDQIEALLNNAIEKMPGDQEQLEQFLALLRRKPQVITKTIVERAPAQNIRSIQLEGRSGASSRGVQGIAHITDDADRRATMEADRLARSEKAREIQKDAAARRAALKASSQAEEESEVRSNTDFGPSRMREQRAIQQQRTQQSQDRAKMLAEAAARRVGREE